MATQQELEWLKSMVPAAQEAQRKFGVPASITLAQCILESSTPKKGWGQSQLALEAHNYFGIKAHHLDLPDTYEEFPTTEYHNGVKMPELALFEKYFDAADCFVDHAHLLAHAPRYSAAMAACDAPARMAFCLQSAGYSTNPHYAQLLVDLMTQHNLFQYDVPPPDAAAKAQEVAAA